MTDRSAGRPAVISGTEFAGIGVQFAGTILVFALAGYWLDGRFGASHVFLVAFLFLGAAGGFFSMYRRVSAVQRRDREERERKQAGPGRP